jgi:hypothetical protein
MGDNAVNQSVEIPIEETTEEAKGNDTFPMAIRELGEALFSSYPDKTSVLSDENILGIIRIETLNEFMLRKYGFRYTSLDAVVEYKKRLVVSKNGYGILQFIELVKSIQASFQQTEIPQTIAQRLLNRR